MSRSIRVPRVSLHTVPVPCRLDAERHADLEAYTAAYDAHDGEAMPLAVLITTLVRDDLQNEQACMRQRRQAASALPARATPDSTATRPRAQDSRDGVCSQP